MRYPWRKDQLPRRDRPAGITRPKSAPALGPCFFNGIIRHQKADDRSPPPADDRSPPPAMVTPTVSPPTGGTAIREGFLRPLPIDFLCSAAYDHAIVRAR